MIIHFTTEERVKLDDLFEKYERLLGEQEAKVDRLRDPNDEPKEPEIESPIAPIYPKKETKKALAEYQKAFTEYQAKVRERNAEVTRLFDEWLAQGSEEWRQARDEYFRLQDEFLRERQKLLSEIERTHFAQLGGDKKKIIADARSQASELIINRYEEYKKIAQTGTHNGEELTGFSARDLRVDGSELWLDAQEIADDIRQCLRLHYEALRDDPDGISQLDKVIRDVLVKNPHVSGNKGEKGGKLTFERMISVKTTRPEEMIAVTAKVAQETFLGDLLPGTGKRVNVQKKAQAKKNPVYTLVSISLDDLKGQGVEIKGRRELTPFDQEIHDAFVSHALSGNEYITDSMIFDTISGKEGATLNPKQQEAISNSITKLMYSHVKIDASEEAKKFGLEKFVYDGSVLPGERLTVSLNGTVTECVHIFRTPPIYDYANRLSQVGRMDVKLLNSPVNKNEETITLQGYLYRRILSMKGSSKLSPTILYETVYKQIDLSNIKSDSALRNKKQKIRETTKKILDFWKKEGFIKGHTENVSKGDKGRIVSVTIRL